MLLEAGDGATVRTLDKKVEGFQEAGSGWQKMKPRFVTTVGSRAINAEQGVKQDKNLKFSGADKLQSAVDQAQRSRLVNGSMKLVKVHVPSSSNSSSVPKRSELEGNVSERRQRSRVHKHKPAAALNKKTQEKLYGTISASMEDSLPIHPPSRVLQGGEISANGYNVSGVGAVSNHKCPVSAGPSTQGVTKWVGHKPRNVRRDRRVFPVSNRGQSHASPQVLLSLNCAATSSCGNIDSQLVESASDSNPHLEEKLDVPCPVSISEDEELALMENMEGTDFVEAALNADCESEKFLSPTVNLKLSINKEENGDNVQGLGEDGRDFTLSRPDAISMREKSIGKPEAKPTGKNRARSDKKKRCRRPSSRKLVERKTSVACVPVQKRTSDIAGEMVDDYDTLLRAAKEAYRFSNKACSSPFWKQMECYFASVSSEDYLLLRHQLALLEDLDAGLSQMLGGESIASIPVGGRKDYSDEEPFEVGGRFGGFDMDKISGKNIPLYQRVLSALINEDEDEQPSHQNEVKILSFQSASDGSYCDSCNHIDAESKDGDRIESDVESEVDLQTHKPFLLSSNSCSIGSITNIKVSDSVFSSSRANEQRQADIGLPYSDAGVASGICQITRSFPPLDVATLDDNSSVNEYQSLSLDDRLMMELQNLGLYPAKLPHLAEGEEGVQQDIIELQAGLYQQVRKKRRSLVKLDKSLEFVRDLEKRNMMQLVMDRVIEFADRKKMAFRDARTSRSVMRQISKKTAAAFAKRTLDRCRDFENTGRSCFDEPAFHEILFPGLPGDAEVKVKHVRCIGPRTGKNVQVGGSDARGAASLCPSSDQMLHNHENLSNEKMEVPAKPSADIICKGNKSKSNRKRKPDSSLTLDDADGIPTGPAGPPSSSADRRSQSRGGGLKIVEERGRPTTVQISLNSSKVVGSEDFASMLLDESIPTDNFFDDVTIDASLDDDDQCLQDYEIPMEGLPEFLAF